MASLAVTHGSVRPALLERATRIPRALASPPSQASGRASGSTSVTGTLAGGGRSVEASESTPAGIGSLNKLAGPDTSQTIPCSTASRIAVSTTDCSAFGMTSDSV